MSILSVTRPRAIAGAIALLVLATGTARAQNAPQPFKDWEAASLPESLRVERVSNATRSSA